MPSTSHLRRRVGCVLATALLLVVVAACSSDGGDGGGAASTTDGSTTSAGAPDSAPLTDEELAAEVYVAGHPLVVSTRTFQRLGGLVGQNELFWQTALSGPETRVIVAPNRDTLYSIAVIDLRSEPLALTLPEIDDRYFTYQLLDAWTESFAYIGTRATDGRAGTWVITPPGWEGELPDGAEQVEAPTNQVFLLGRYLVDDEADIANVTAIRDETTLEPLSTLTGEDPAPPPPPLGEAAGTAQDIPVDASFSTELSTAVAVNPPTTPAQQDLFARAEAAGIIGVDGAAPTADPAVLDAGAAEGDARIDEAESGRSPEGGWSSPDEVGTYGDDLLQRALVARVGWGANVPEEAYYSIARTDAEGEPLTGERTYRIRFAADAVPPVDAFWSLTAYGPDLFFAPHPSGRYTIGDRTPGLTAADDGSLEVIVSATEPPPGPDGAAPAWLPVPDGPFVMMLRLYLPQAEVVDGSWTPPPIEVVD